MAIERSADQSLGCADSDALRALSGPLLAHPATGSPPNQKGDLRRPGGAPQTA